MVAQMQEDRRAGAFLAAGEEMRIDSVADRYLPVSVSKGHVLGAHILKRKKRCGNHRRQTHMFIRR